MKQVWVAELKAQLSKYLRARRRGMTIRMWERETPVGEIMPVGDSDVLRIRKPASSTPASNRDPLPKPLKLYIDVVQLLFEERPPQR